VSLGLERLISEVEKQLDAGDDDKAMLMATQLVEKYPNEFEVWSLRAHLHARNRDYLQAVADLSHAIVINPNEPCLFFERGWSYLRLREAQSATRDFSEGLNLCERYGSDYYREILHFMRAEALLSMRRPDDALADLAHVREEFTMWTYKLRSKSDLVAECRKLQGKSEI
jgi:tetratricopeptide (TPR) repeat protein